MQTMRRITNIRYSQHPCANSLAGVINADGWLSSAQELVNRQFHPEGSRLQVRCAVTRRTDHQAFHRQLHEDRQNASPLDNRVITAIANPRRLSVCVTGLRTAVRNNVVRAQHVVLPQSITARRSRQAVGVAGYNPDLHALVPLPVQDGEPQTQDRSQPQEFNPSPALKRGDTPFAPFAQRKGRERGERGMHGRTGDAAPPFSFGHFPRTAGETPHLWIPAVAGTTWGVSWLASPTTRQQKRKSGVGRRCG